MAQKQSFSKIYANFFSIKILSTVKLGDKEHFDREQIGDKELCSFGFGKNWNYASFTVPVEVCHYRPKDLYAV